MPIRTGMGMPLETAVFSTRECHTSRKERQRGGRGEGRGVFPIPSATPSSPTFSSPTLAHRTSSTLTSFDTGEPPMHRSRAAAAATSSCVPHGRPSWPHATGRGPPFSILKPRDRGRGGRPTTPTGTTPRGMVNITWYTSTVPRGHTSRTTSTCASAVPPSRSLRWIAFGPWTASRWARDHGGTTRVSHPFIGLLLLWTAVGCGGVLPSFSFLVPVRCTAPGTLATSALGVLERRGQTTLTTTTTWRMRGRTEKGIVVVVRLFRSRLSRGGAPVIPTPKRRCTGGIHAFRG